MKNSSTGTAPETAPKIAERIYAETQAYYEALAISLVVAPAGKETAADCWAGH